MPVPTTPLAVAAAVAAERRPGQPSHWLFKSEPETYAITQLERERIAGWEGVRNYQSRNYMRDAMHVGDLGFFYHSSCAVPGVVGLLRVEATGVVDPTQFDPESPYHDPKATRAAPRWHMVQVAFVARWHRPVTLADLKDDPVCASMLVAQPGARLSIQPVLRVHAERLLARAR